jgi:hypothetical protein
MATTEVAVLSQSCDLGSQLPQVHYPLVLGLMQQKYPGVALSVKTRHAIRAVLNHCRNTFEQLREGGVLEEHDSYLLSQVRKISSCRLAW